MSLFKGEMGRKYAKEYGRKIFTSSIPTVVLNDIAADTLPSTVQFSP